MSIKSIVFIDSRVSDHQSFIDGLSEPAEVFILDGGSDGVAQMADYFKGRTGIDGIHVISHGSQGALYLGSAVLNSGNLDEYGLQLASIGRALTPTGDILLYGCNVALGNDGLQFITSLAQVTGADVAGSDDATGAATLGGDAQLERVSGRVEAVGLPVDTLTELLTVNTRPFFSWVGDGWLTTNFGAIETGSSVTLQSDGKIVVAGTSGGNFALARYNNNGSLDESFDIDGKITTDFGVTSFGRSVIMQTDGKILIAGSSGGNFALARYNSNGSLDTSFDTDGKATTNFGFPVFGSSVTLQSDGKILVVGSSYGNFALARYNSNGSLDGSFDGDGKINSNFGSGKQGSGSSVTVQDDGKILVLGTVGDNKDFYLINTYFSLTRYNNNGTIDTGFGIGGQTATDFGGSNSGSSVTMQADGKILVAGSSGGNFALARYDRNGSLDTSFDTDGKITTDFSAEDVGSSVTVQKDGKILVGGSSSGKFALARYNNNGSLDTSFGFLGKLTINSGAVDIGLSVVMQPDGKILFAGTSGSDFGLARLTSSGSLDSYFDAETFSKVYPTYAGSSPVVLDSKIQIFDQELSFANNFSGSTLTLERYSGANINDVFSVRSGSTSSAMITGNYFSVDGILLGLVVSNKNGMLKLGFNSDATQSLINTVMREISYENTAPIPPSSALIKWTFNDGNTGSQGSGGSSEVAVNTRVDITARNVAPVVANALLDLNILPNAPFIHQLPINSFFDANQIYSPGSAFRPINSIATLENGSNLPSWLSYNPFSQTFQGNTSGLGIYDSKVFDIKVTVTDFSGATAFDIFRLTVTNGTLIGNIGNETFMGGTGNDRVDGGGGLDTFVLSGNRSNYVVTNGALAWTVQSSSEGSDALLRVERLKFSDVTVALDIDGNGGQAYRVYQAAFNRTPDAGGLGFWINTMDGGASLRSVAEGFVGSAEFKTLYGANPTNAQIVTKLYDNVLHRPGETGGFNFWLGVLDSKAETLAGVLAAFSESAENQAGLLGVIGNGFAYTPFV